jgi:hypothetical protein
MRSIQLAIFSMLLLSGCQTFTAYRYSISVDNVTALKALTGTQINIGKFTATQPDQTKKWCRGFVNIVCPDSKTFEEYIRKAFIDELKLANLYSQNSSVTLTGNFDKIDFSSIAGTWYLVATIKSSNGKAISINDTYSYESNLSGVSTCSHTAQVFKPAVQNFISRIIKHKDFPSLIGMQPIKK